MKLASFEAIVRALDEAAVRYLVAGGLAVNAHGYLRFTKDIDIVLQLDRDNTVRALEALARLGYRPAVPVDPMQFADAAQRRRWIREKHMQVLQLWSDDHRETPIDIFVDEPFDFDEEYGRALVKPLYETIEVRFVSLPALIRMKEAAGRAPRTQSISTTCAGGSKTVTTNKEHREDIDWTLTTWEGATREQLRRWSRLSLEEIIAAQEEMAELQEQLARVRATPPPG